MAKRFETVTINAFTINKDGMLEKRARDYAAPANVTDLTAFVKAVEGVQLYTLYRKYAEKESRALERHDDAAAMKYSGICANIDAAMPIDMNDAAAARYTVAGAVGFAFFSACRGKVGDMELIPAGGAPLYDAACKVLDAANKNYIDAARKAVHAAIETVMSDILKNDGDSEFSKTWRTRIKKHHIDAAAAAARMTRTTYGKRGIQTRGMKISDVTKEIIALVLRDCFSFTVVTTTTTTKW